MTDVLQEKKCFSVKVLNVSDGGGKQAEASVGEISDSNSFIFYSELRAVQSSVGTVYSHIKRF